MKEEPPDFLVIDDEPPSKTITKNPLNPQNNFKNILFYKELQ